MRRSWFSLCLAVFPLILVTCGCGGNSDPGPQFDSTAANAPPPPVSNPAPAAPTNVASSESDSEASEEEERSEEESSEEGEEMAGGGLGPAPGSPGGPPAGMGGMMGMMGSSSNQGYDSSSMSADYSAMGSSMGGAPGMSGMSGMSGMANMFNGMTGAGPGEADPTPDEDADYLTKGKYAFGIGKEKEAVEYAMAHAIAAVGTSEASEVFGKTKWLTVSPLSAAADDKKSPKNKPMQRPATIARFAVGILLDAPTSLTDLKPIGSKQRGGGGGSMMGSEGSGGGNANAKTKERALYEVTGTFGEAVVNAWAERWTSGQFGTVYNEVEPIKPRATNRNAMGGMMGMMGSSKMMMGSEGSSNSPDMEAMGAMMGSMGGSSSATTAPKVMPNTSVKPGLFFVGTVTDKAKQGDLLKKAEQQGVDAIFIFDVSVTGPNRAGIVENKARVRLVNSKGELLARSNELINTKLERAQMTQSTDDDDELEKSVEKFFAQVDERIKLADMPALKPEHAKGRIVQILGNDELTRLQKLYEISLYRSLNLLSEQDHATACLIVMQGSEGEALAKGSALDRQLVLDGLLPSYR